MRKLYRALLAAAVVAGPALAQTPAPAPAKAPATTTTAAGTVVKAVQPGLFEVAGPRVNEVIAVGIQKITATPSKGGRSIHVQSPWGDSFYGWPKNVKQVAFTIETGKPAGGATISAPKQARQPGDDACRPPAMLASRAGCSTSPLGANPGVGHALDQDRSVAQVAQCA